MATSLAVWLRKAFAKLGISINKHDCMSQDFVLMLAKFPPNAVRGDLFSMISRRNRLSRLGMGLVPLIMLALVTTAESREITDAQGRTITIEKTDRILSLGPDVTEIVFALGGGDRIIARDRSSRYPEGAEAKLDVGYRRTLSPEALIGLTPDLILSAEDIGPPEAVDVLEGVDIPMVYVPEDNSPEGIARKIDIIAAVLGAEDQAVALKAQVLADFEAAAALGASIPEAQRKKVVFFHGLLRLTGAGSGTSADAIIRYSGGINPLTVYDGYKAVSEESLLQFEPEVILLMSDGKGGPTPEEVFAVPALALTPAAKTQSLIVLDGPYMLGFGPRTASAVRDLAVALYPELSD
jgi:iron complex transport system substrate-binding protein